MWKILKNKIKQRKPMDNEKLILGSTFSGKTPMLINGLDLYYLLVLLNDKQITIIEPSKQTLYEGNASGYNPERVRYEVMQFEKIPYNNSYTIIVKRI